MRIVAVLIASTHICLVACQPAPGSLLPPPSAPGGISLLDSPPATTPPPPKASTPYMRCVTDFWGNCTGVVSSRHQYRWRYVRPGTRPKEMRESPTARANNIQEEGPIQKAVLRITPPVQANGAHESSAASEKAAVAERAPRKPAPAREAAPRQRTVTVAENLQACHARRRVVGDERPSQDDARRAAEDGWMGAIRYDYGERYQDINKAKDVRLNCGPSSVSKALKTPYFRCAVEATPCRQMKGVPTEPDERRYEQSPEESQISRR